MSSCPCGKTICRITSDNSYFPHHCSHYCWIYYQNPEAYPSHVYGNGSPHHRNHFRRPLIMADCEMCGKSFSLSHDLKKGNKIFCSQSCAHQLIGSKKHALRDFAILKLLKVHGELSAHEIVKLHQNPQRPLSYQSIAMTLRCGGYLRRNIVQTTKQGNQPRIYRFNPNAQEQPLGQVMLSKHFYE